MPRQFRTALAAPVSGKSIRSMRSFRMKQGLGMNKSESRGSYNTSQTSLNSSNGSMSVGSVGAASLVSYGANSVKFQASQFIAKSCDALEEHYDMFELLGEGGFGEVYRIVHRESGAERAVKVIPKHSPEEDEKVLHEFNILKDLDHPNILKMYELFEDEDCFYIVTDIYKGGELFDELEHWGTLDENDTAIIMNNVLSCINYCHKKGLVHRDLKPENILLEESKDVSDLKVIDFGLAMRHKRGVDEPMTGLDGSPYYVSPQVIEGCYDSQCDVWTCGVIAFICLAGYAPFDGGEDGATLQCIVDGVWDFDDPVWDEVSDVAKDFISQLLTYDPEERPSAEEALQHPWLADVRELTRSEDHHVINTRASIADLKKFSSTCSKLKQAVCSIISSQLMRKEEKQEIDAIFRSLDVDCDGSISREDMTQSYAQLGVKVSEEEINALFEQVNYSKTGTIEYSEFAIATMLEKDMVDDGKLLTVFKMFDKDGKGHISADDLKDVLKLDDKMDSYITKKIIMQVDSDGDGRIDFEEFKDMMFITNENGMDLQGSFQSLGSQFSLGSKVSLGSKSLGPSFTNTVKICTLDDEAKHDMGLRTSLVTQDSLGKKSLRELIMAFEQQH